MARFSGLDKFQLVPELRRFWIQLSSKESIPTEDIDDFCEKLSDPQSGLDFYNFAKPFLPPLRSRDEGLVSDAVDRICQAAAEYMPDQPQPQPLWFEDQTVDISHRLQQLLIQLFWREGEKLPVDLRIKVAAVFAALCGLPGNDMNDLPPFVRELANMSGPASRKGRKMRFHPQSQPEPGNKTETGVKNHGNTCYQNAMIALLLADPKVNNVLPTLMDVDGSNTSGLCRSMLCSIRAKDFASSLTYLAKFLDELKATGSRFQIGDQQDPTEFLIDVLVPAMDANLQTIWWGMPVSKTLVCSVCGVTDQVDDETDDLFRRVFPKPQQDSHLLDLFLDRIYLCDIIDRSCEKCGTSQWHAATRSPTTPVTGEVSVLVQAYRWHREGRDIQPDKIKSKVSLPPLFFPMPGADQLFFVKAIVVHHGDQVDAGHYTAVVRNDEDQLHLCQVFDDSQRRESCSVIEEFEKHSDSWYLALLQPVSEKMLAEESRVAVKTLLDKPAIVDFWQQRIVEIEERVRGGEPIERQLWAGSVLVEAATYWTHWLCRAFGRRHFQALEDQHTAVATARKATRKEAEQKAKAAKQKAKQEEKDAKRREKVKQREERRKAIEAKYDKKIMKGGILRKKRDFEEPPPEYISSDDPSSSSLDSLDDDLEGERMELDDGEAAEEDATAEAGTIQPAELNVGVANFTRLDPTRPAASEQHIDAITESVAQAYLEALNGRHPLTLENVGSFIERFTGVDVAQDLVVDAIRQRTHDQFDPYADALFNRYHDNLAQHVANREENDAKQAAKIAEDKEREQRAEKEARRLREQRAKHGKPARTTGEEGQNDLDDFHADGDLDDLDFELQQATLENFRQMQLHKNQTRAEGMRETQSPVRHASEEQLEQSETLLANLLQREEQLRQREMILQREQEQFQKREQKFAQFEERAKELGRREEELRRNEEQAKQSAKQQQDAIKRQEAEARRRAKEEDRRRREEFNKKLEAMKIPESHGSAESTPVRGPSVATTPRLSGVPGHRPDPTTPSQQSFTSPDPRHDNKAGRPGIKALSEPSSNRGSGGRQPSHGSITPVKRSPTRAFNQTSPTSRPRRKAKYESINDAFADQQDSSVAQSPRSSQQPSPNNNIAGGAVFSEHAPASAPSTPRPGQHIKIPMRHTSKQATDPLNKLPHIPRPEITTPPPPPPRVRRKDGLRASLIARPSPYDLIASPEDPNQPRRPSRSEQRDQTEKRMQSLDEEMGTGEDDEEESESESDTSDEEDTKMDDRSADDSSPSGGASGDSEGKDEEGKDDEDDGEDDGEDDDEDDGEDDDEDGDHGQNGSHRGFSGRDISPHSSDKDDEDPSPVDDGDKADSALTSNRKSLDEHMEDVSSFNAAGAAPASQQPATVTTPNQPHRGSHATIPADRTTGAADSNSHGHNITPGDPLRTVELLGTPQQHLLGTPLENATPFSEVIRRSEDVELRLKQLQRDVQDRNTTSVPNAASDSSSHDVDQDDTTRRVRFGPADEVPDSETSKIEVPQDEAADARDASVPRVGANAAARASNSAANQTQAAGINRAGNKAIDDQPSSKTGFQSREAGHKSANELTNPQHPLRSKISTKFHEAKDKSKVKFQKLKAKSHFNLRGHAQATSDQFSSTEASSRPERPRRSQSAEPLDTASARAPHGHDHGRGRGRGRGRVRQPPPPLGSTNLTSATHLLPRRSPRFTAGPYRSSEPPSTRDGAVGPTPQRMSARNTRRSDGASRSLSRPPDDGPGKIDDEK